GWAAGWAAGAGPVAVPDSSIVASSTPASTVSSSPTLIAVSTPDAGEGISVSTLSVDTSSSGSSALTCSPSFFSQRVTVPSVTLSPRRGIVTETGMGLGLLCDLPVGAASWSVDVQGFAGQRQVRFADRLGLGGVRVDELGDLAGQRLPVVDELGLRDQLADPAAHQVGAEHRAVLDGDQLHRAGGLEDLAL